jgi:UDP-xylose:glucoside alpha-1,3-xylosyltransferase
VVVCGIDRVDESLVMVKSALIFANDTSTPLNFVVIAEDRLHEVIEQRLKNFKNYKNFTHEIVALKFPDANRELWQKLFKPCASQRLFLPSLLPHVDSLIYVDCDVLFVSSPHDLHAHFRSFDREQISALAAESENRNTGWYTRFARHPYFEPFGLNSGVMLMNLTRMRAVGFEGQIEPIYEKWRNQLAWGDQDILNIYFSQHPGEVRVMACGFNYRPDHCMYTSNCELGDGGGGGVRLVHGNRGYFHKEGKQRIFREIYLAVEEVSHLK